MFFVLEMFAREMPWCLARLLPCLCFLKSALGAGVGFNNKLMRRILKTHAFYQRRCSGTFVVVPLIRLSGKWLKEYGWGVDERITVLVSANKIEILKC